MSTHSEMQAIVSIWYLHNYEQDISTKNEKKGDETVSNITKKSY